MPDIKQLQKTLGISFNNPVLLEQALVHSSYINENPACATGHNERLEFLGDAVLDFIVADKLYHDFPAISEGDMTRLRAVLVRRETLARVAKAINLGGYLFMGRGEEATGGRNKIPNLAGALEALIAAVYLDLGIEVAGKLINGWFTEDWKKLSSKEAIIDYKSRLQEVAQAKFQEIPVYRLVSETGPDHDKQFEVEVSVKNRVMGNGKGKSKKNAETEAAREALQHLSGDFTS